MCVELLLGLNLPFSLSSPCTEKCQLLYTGRSPRLSLCPCSIRRALPASSPFSGYEQSFVRAYYVYPKITRKVKQTESVLIVIKASQSPRQFKMRKVNLCCKKLCYLFWLGDAFPRLIFLFYLSCDVVNEPKY